MSHLGVVVVVAVTAAPQLSVRALIAVWRVVTVATAAAALAYYCAITGLHRYRKK